MELNKGAFAWLAAGFTTAFGTLQTAVVKSALDFHYYERHIDLYVPINMLICLGMIFCQVVAAGALMDKVKQKID